MTMNEARPKITTEEGSTKSVAIKTGVQQGDSLSTTLLNIAVEGTVKASKIKGTIAHSSTQIVAYEDDLVLMGRDKERLKEAVTILTKEARKRALEINEGKTKYLLCFRREALLCFKYLVVIVNAQNKRSKKVTERILAGNKTYWRYHRLMMDKNLSRNTKLKIYGVAFRPVVTYAAETMYLTEKDEEELRIFERKILRPIMGPIRMDNGNMRRNMNQVLRDIMKGEEMKGDVVRSIKAQTLR
ncbi:uncharacterized protein [Diabrotica undecimpunctata]|uniref:uncharacterized protein n=1 Tax=Diabrotica undecimpunctata TaxID=50387 RepID=UPI003B638B31